MPPPEPRSSTVSPGMSLASAVGFPQPSEHCFFGNFVCLERVVKVGGYGIIAAAAGAGSAARTAACRRSEGGLAILFFYSFLDIAAFHDLFSYLHSWTICSGLTALFRVQHSAYRNCRSCCKALVFAV